MANGHKKHGKVKKSSSQQRYTAEQRWLKNAKRRAVKQMKVLARHAAKAPVVALKRAQGAVARLRRRLVGNPSLAPSLAKAEAAVARLRESC